MLTVVKRQCPFLFCFNAGLYSHFYFHSLAQVSVDISLYRSQGQQLFHCENRKQEVFLSWQFCSIQYSLFCLLVCPCNLRDGSKKLHHKGMKLPHKISVGCHGFCYIQDNCYVGLAFHLHGHMVGFQSGCFGAAFHTMQYPWPFFLCLKFNLSILCNSCASKVVNPGTYSTSIDITLALIIN